MKRLYKKREDWANEGTSINTHSEHRSEGPKIDTLDNMQNMKNQYGSMYRRNKGIKQARNELAASDNTKIKDFFPLNNQSKNLNTIEEEKSELILENQDELSASMNRNLSPNIDNIDMKSNESIISDEGIMEIEEDIQNDERVNEFTEKHNQELGHLTYRYKFKPPSWSNVKNLIEQKRRELKPGNWNTNLT